MLWRGTKNYDLLGIWSHQKNLSGLYSLSACCFFVNTCFLSLPYLSFDKVKLHEITEVGSRFWLSWKWNSCQWFTFCLWWTTTLTSDSRTRGHSWKIVKRRSSLDIRKYFCSERVVHRWNSLSQEDVDQTTLNGFKKALEKKRMIRTDFFYGLSLPSLKWLHHVWTYHSDTGVTTPGKLPGKICQWWCIKTNYMFFLQKKITTQCKVIKFGRQTNVWCRCTHFFICITEDMCIV